MYPESARAIRRSVMLAARSGIDWIDDISFDRESWTHTRNQSFLQAQKYEGVDGVLWCDDDMVPETTAFTNLVNSGHDITAALCFARRPPYPACAWYEDPIEIITDYDQGLTKVHGIGFGCVYTSMKVLNAVGGFDHPRLISEDRHWCKQARARGFEVWVDTHVRVGHIAGHVIVDERISLMEQGRYSAAPGLPFDRDP